MFLRQPIPQARRQQQIFIRIVRTVALAHRTLWDHPVSKRQQKLCGDIDFSDGLLVRIPTMPPSLCSKDNCCLALRPITSQCSIWVIQASVKSDEIGWLESWRIVFR